METTVVLLKPDCLQRGLVGEVVHRFEARGFKIVGMKMLQADDKLLAEHYAHLADKPFFPMIRKFMQSAPIIAMAVEGLDSPKVIRAMTGVTNAREAAPGTIRGDYALSIQSNILHASDSSESAKKELARFFSEQELFNWNKIDQAFLYSEEDLGK
jgi:nucleoside-diphosphate kinase